MRTEMEAEMKLVKLAICFILLFSWIGVASAIEELTFHRILYVNEWGGALDTEEKVKSIIDDAVYMNCDAVMLYVPSEYFEAAKNPAHSNWDSRVSWNMLETAIEYAHDNNMELHVWYHVNYASSYLRAEKRLWSTEYNFVYRVGAIHPYRMDLAFGELFNYEIENIEFIAEHYPELDGIHLEEPYYPYSQSYSTAMRDRIKSKYGYDPLYKPEADMIPIINEEMAQVINEFFTEARATTTNANPNLQLSANGLHRFSEHTGFDPSYMASNSLLDWYAAQIYRTNTYGSNGFEDCVEKLNEFVTEIPIVAISGITYSRIYPSTNPEFFEQVEKACGFGSDAVGIFAWHYRNELINGKTAMEGLHDIVPQSMEPPSTQTMNISHTPTLVIDGLKDDWAGMSGVSFNDDSGRSSADNTANVKAAWDDSYLYFSFEVADTNLQAVETVRDGALTHDDVVEIYIDTLNNDGSLMQTDDYHFLVNLNNAVADQKGTGSGMDAIWDCSIVSTVTIDGTVGDASDIDTGYFVELAIPWSDIGGTPLEGSVIGLDLAIGDQDSIADVYHYFDWSNLTSFAYPDGWGDAFLIDNTAPIFDPIGDKSVDIGSPLQFTITITATDPDNDPLTYSTGILPGGATFDPATRTFSWTPADGQAGLYTVHFEVTDSSLIDAEDITITVTEETEDLPPTASAGPDRTTNPGASITFDGSASIDDNGITSYVWDFDDSDRLQQDATGVEVTHTYDTAGTYTVTLTVTDTNSSTDSDTTIITVSEVNRAPVLNPIGNRSVYEDSLLQFTINATDPDGDSLSYSAVGLPTGAALNGTSGIFTWTPANGQASSYQVHFEVSDGSFIDTEDITITVNDITAEMSYIWVEAEDADEINPSVQPASDPSASNNTYIWIPEVEGFRGPGYAKYIIIIPTTGEYKICGRIIAETSSDNSFFVQVDDNAERLWTMPVANNWIWDEVNHWGNGTESNPEIDPVVFNLSAGEHILIIKHREDGAKLDRLLMTNNMTYIPQGDMSPLNHAPILYLIGNRFVNAGSPLQFTISATDPDSDPLTYSATGLPTGATFNSTTRTLSWTPGENQTGTYRVHFEVTDSYLNDSENIMIAVNEPKISPTPSVKPTMNISYTSSPVIDGLKDDWAVMSGVSFGDDSGRGSADNTVNVKAAWDDNYLYFSFEVADTNLQAVEVVRDGAISRDDAVEIYIDTLNDDGSLMQIDDYHFLVNLNNAVADQKGTGSVKDASWDCGIVSAVTMDGTLWDASDIDKGYFVELAIPWSDIGGTPLEGGVIGLDLAIGDRDSIADGYQYFDWSNLTSFAYPDGWGDAFLINNTAPILDPIGDKSVDIGSPLQFTISATDPDSNPLTYSTGILPGGATFNSTTRTFSWTTGETQAGSYKVHFEVTDDSLSDAEDITITVTEEAVYPLQKSG